MRISAKVDYALRASIELAAVCTRADQGRANCEPRSRSPTSSSRTSSPICGTVVSSPVSGERKGGYRLALPPDEITVADVIRVVEGPIASIRGERPDDLEYEGASSAAARCLDRAPDRDARRARADDARRPRRARHGSGNAARAANCIGPTARVRPRPQRRVRGAPRPRRSAPAPARAPRAAPSSTARATGHRPQRRARPERRTRSG